MAILPARLTDEERARRRRNVGLEDSVRPTTPSTQDVSRGGGAPDRNEGSVAASANTNQSGAGMVVNVGAGDGHDGQSGSGGASSGGFTRTPEAEAAGDRTGVATGRDLRDFVPHNITGEPSDVLRTEWSGLYDAQGNPIPIDDPRAANAASAAQAGGASGGLTSTTPAQPQPTFPTSTGDGGTTGGGQTFTITLADGRTVTVSSSGIETSGDATDSERTVTLPDGTQYVFNSGSASQIENTTVDPTSNTTAGQFVADVQELLQGGGAFALGGDTSRITSLPAGSSPVDQNGSPMSPDEEYIIGPVAFQDAFGEWQTVNGFINTDTGEIAMTTRVIDRGTEFERTVFEPIQSGAQTAELQRQQQVSDMFLKAALDEQQAANDFERQAAHDVQLLAMDQLFELGTTRQQQQFERSERQASERFAVNLELMKQRFDAEQAELDRAMKRREIELSTGFAFGDVQGAIRARQEREALERARFRIEQQGQMLNMLALLGQFPELRGQLQKVAGDMDLGGVNLASLFAGDAEIAANGIPTIQEFSAMMPQEQRRVLTELSGRMGLPREVIIEMIRNSAPGGTERLF